MSEKTYNTEDAAKRAGVHYVTLRRWLARGKFTPSVGIEMADGRKLWRFTEADVRDLAKLAKERRWNWPGQGRPPKKREK